MNAPRELTITRIFNAPRELVFKAWTDSNLVQKWWGPYGVTNPICEIDARQNGGIHIVMLAGEELGELKGQKWPLKGEFQEIVEPEKIVFISRALRNGKTILENHNTVTFEEQNGKTTMILHVVVKKAAPEAEGPLSGMKLGWSQSLEKLTQLVSLLERR